ncbi:hypothetical protein [Flagellimonas flava]|uniref:Uncharacterized protein n=1 Tax=Flagellimonas flava TaxID=570519 RepID=A0A1M5IKA5_9FLAO|nr:hypothetical protein [Allomuricauda flava]SHG28701.1 hypothetical protein SAMN04488116_0764 [Allomuricauda flava]
MAEISTSIEILFMVTTLVTLWCFYQAHKSGRQLVGIFIWMAVVGVLGYLGFYRVQNAIPPRFVFLLLPGILFVIVHFFLTKNNIVGNGHNLKWLTLVHTIRVPVEIVLYYVFIAGFIPDLMTFEGYNYDILSGISAPIIYYAVFVKKWIGKKGLLLWNFICLGLLVNILTIAFLSAETPIQQLAFDQPNVGVAYFPFVWLPAVIVPIVLYSHLESIKILLEFRNNTAANNVQR